ncbi:reductase [Fusarium sp. NRRL 52700]|nr:reductase [Fusarium sp. NRRL 52700]
MTFHPDSLPDLTGRVYIVTGGNSGMGLYTVSHLARHGAHVYMCSRSRDKGNKAIAEIQKDHPATKIDLLQIDLMDLASVVAAAKHFLSLETSLHGLINNAGIMATPFEMTKDGHEAQWETNYLSHWVFTEHLIPVMLKTSKSSPPGTVRIVNLSSSGHLMAPKNGINFEDTSLKEASVWERYGQSKLANILHSKTLHNKYGPSSGNKEGEIWTTSVHPGLVETNLSSSVDSAETGSLRLVSLLRCMKLMWTADKGSWNSLFCAASPDMKPKQSGEYMEIYHRLFEPWWQNSASKDEELAENLDQWTRETMRKEEWIQ